MTITLLTTPICFRWRFGSADQQTVAVDAVISVSAAAAEYDHGWGIGGNIHSLSNQLGGQPRHPSEGKKKAI